MKWSRIRLVALFQLNSNRLTKEEDVYTWVIVSIEQNPFDREHSPTDPEAFYSWKLRCEGSQWFSESGFPYSDVDLLMKYFGAANAGELTAKKFESEKDEASTALNYLLTVIRSGGSYTPPSTISLRERAIDALARMETPDFGNVDDETLATAFQEVWSGFNAKPEWLDKFKASIFARSGGQVILIDANAIDFSARVKGPAEYLMLVRNGEKQKVIMGPYSSPVTFVD